MAAIAVSDIQVEAWIAALPADRMAQLAKDVDKFDSRGSSDTAIRAYAELIQEMELLKQAEKRISEAKLYLTAEMKKAYMKFITCEDGKKKPQKFVTAVQLRAARNMEL